MKKKRRLPLLAAALLLACLAGCVDLDGPPEEASPYEGVWYFSKNAVECQAAGGKIYQDDYWAAEGQSLIGVYKEVDGHIEANLAGVGGVYVPRMLYVAQTDAGEVLCDSADGNGIIYFYRDALAAMSALEEAEAANAAAPAPSASAAPQESDVSPPDGPKLQSEPAPGDAAAPEDSADPSSQPAAAETGDLVWVPQSGSRYHSSPTCSGMKSPTQMTRLQAENRGYTPCKRCY